MSRRSRFSAELPMSVESPVSTTAWTPNWPTSSRITPYAAGLLCTSETHSTVVVSGPGTSGRAPRAP